MEKEKKKNPVKDIWPSIWSNLVKKNLEFS